MAGKTNRRSKPSSTERWARWVVDELRDDPNALLFIADVIEKLARASRKSRSRSRKRPRCVKLH